LVADDVKPGEHFVYIADDFHQQLRLVQVNNVTGQYKTGLYNIATNEGTIIVNNIAASCYSNYTTIRIAHNVLGLFRLYYKLAKWFSIEEPFQIPKTSIPKPIKFLADNINFINFSHDLILSIVWLVEIEGLVAVVYLIQIILQKNIKMIGNFQ